MDGYFSLPPETLRFINLFATVVLHPGQGGKETPVLLERADGISLSDPRLVTIPLSQRAHDYYRIGVGIDLTSFIQRVRFRIATVYHH